MAGAFAQARRLTTWHYQWLILHEFLPLFVGQPMVDDVLRRGRRFYRPARRGLHAGRVPGRRLPVRAQHGAALVPREPRRRRRQAVLRVRLRPSQRAAGRSRRPPRRLPRAAAVHRLADVLRLRRRPGQAEQADRHARSRRRSSTCRSARSPATIRPTALPQRNLLRHLTWSLPSGQSVAARDGGRAARRRPTSTNSRARLGLERDTPLWYYVLKEAEVIADGLHLGPVGGRIVAEVIIGLLQTDPGRSVSAQPTLDADAPGRGPASSA